MAKVENKKSSKQASVVKGKRSKSCYDPSARRGQRDKYHEWITPEGLALLEGWARNGLTDLEIATKMGISTVTLYDYKKRFPNIVNALKINKEYADIQVEQALFKKTLGHTIKETRIETMPGGATKTIIIEREVPPDAISQIFWLKNRNPDKWREKQEVVQEVNLKPSPANDAILEALTSRKVEE